MNRQAITQGMDGTSETPDHRPSCSRHPQEKENAMNVCMRSCWTAAAAVVLLSMIQPAVIRAADTEAQMPWEKVGANVGVFLAGLDSSIRIGSGIGVDIDVEEALDLDSTNTVFRADALWRFTKNKRHRLDLIWFAFRRDGDRRILDDIPIEDDDGEVIIIPSGTTVETFFDLDIYQLNYSYSFFQDERIDLAAGIGVYIMPIDFGIRVSGLVDDEGEEKFTAPLPVINLRMDIALTPKWFIRTGAQVFYLEYENFTGSILEFRTALEYNPWKHVGIGVGFDTFGFRLEADGEDWPGIDLKGNVEFNYAGLQLYLRMFY
jgi:hypothetical protein